MNNTALTTIAAASSTMTSREIAELTGKEHFHVIRDIRTMLAELDHPVLDHVQETKDARGYTAHFSLPKDLTLTLVSGYSAPLRHRIVTRWMELETVQAPVRETPALTLARALLLAQDTINGLTVQAEGMDPAEQEVMTVKQWENLRGVQLAMGVRMALGRLCRATSRLSGRILRDTSAAGHALHEVTALDRSARSMGLL